MQVNKTSMWQKYADVKYSMCALNVACNNSGVPMVFQCNPDPPCKRRQLRRR